jgi:2-keto-3-deoxy-L-rhamnonate aldolase RhmA
VESTEQLDEVQQAVLMPPRGRRRPGGMGNYWMRDFQYETWKSDFEDHFIVIPQIESQTGVDNVDSIVGHSLVTALGLGPYDLSADLGCCWNPDHEEFVTALDQVKAAADAVGKKVWAGCDAPALRAKGYTFLWVGTASLVLTTALTKIVREARDPPVNIFERSAAPPPA